MEKIQDEPTTVEGRIGITRCPDLEIRMNTPKGRGVFATQRIKSGTIVDTCPVLILSKQDNEHAAQTSLYHYSYNWPVKQANGQTVQQQAIIFGLGSMFNHSTRNQNVVWTRDLEHEIVIYTAMRDIQSGEELCISYGSNLWFKDADPSTPPETEQDALTGFMIDP